MVKKEVSSIGLPTCSMSDVCSKTLAKLPCCRKQNLAMERGTFPTEECESGQGSRHSMKKYTIEDFCDCEEDTWSIIRVACVASVEPFEVSSRSLSLENGVRKDVADRRWANTSSSGLIVRKKENRLKGPFLSASMDKVDLQFRRTH